MHPDYLQPKPQPDNIRTMPPAALFDKARGVFAPVRLWTDYRNGQLAARLADDILEIVGRVRDTVVKEMDAEAMQDLRKIRDQGNTIAALRGEISDRKAGYTSLWGQFNDVRSDNYRLRAEVSTLDSKLAEAKVQRQRLEDEIRAEVQNSQFRTDQLRELLSSVSAQNVSLMSQTNAAAQGGS